VAVGVALNAERLLLGTIGEPNPLCEIHDAGQPEVPEDAAGAE